MHGQINLTEIALVVVGALICGLIFARLKKPPILGYILAGILMGPSGLGFIHSRDQVGTLAELGVLLLLFVIGMELSLRTFKKYWVVSVLAVVGQIAISLGVASLVGHFLGWSLGLTVLLGFVISLSSTAVVFKMLESIDEAKTDTGQITIGILIAQDLAIVPMILILRNFESSWFDTVLITKLIVSMGLLALLIAYLSRKQRVRLPLTQMIAGEKELTPLASLTVCFGAAAISGLIGLSAAYGAFLGGLVLGNTHERLVMIETTKPIQSILLMAFFLSIGLLLDLRFIWENLGTVLILVLLITVGKTAINVSVFHVLRLPWSQAFLVGVVLAQLGEFAFLLTTIGHESKIINPFGEKLIIALTVLSLCFSPFWLSAARRLKVLADGKNLSFSNVLYWLYGGQMRSVQKKFKHFMDEVMESPKAITDQRKKRPKDQQGDHDDEHTLLEGQEDHSRVEDDDAPAASYKKKKPSSDITDI